MDSRKVALMIQCHDEPGVRRAILAVVAVLESESVDLLCRLVRCPSILGNEYSALNEMARLYESLGLLPRRVPVLPDALQDHPCFSPPLIP